MSDFKKTTTQPKDSDGQRIVYIFILSLGAAVSSQGAMDNRCVITAQNSKPLVLGSTNPEFPTCLAYEATSPDHASPVYFWDLMYLFDSFHHRRSKSALFINDIQCLAQEGEIQRHARTNRLGAISESLKNMLIFVFSTPRNNTPTCPFLSLCVFSKRPDALPTNVASSKLI